MFKLYRYLFPGVIVLVLGFRLGTLLLIRSAPVFDEPTHLQVVQQFGPGLPAISQLRDYPSATGPFFYVLFGNLGALRGYNPTLLRLAVFALALGNMLLFHRIVRRLLPTEDPMPALALLATAPYFAALAGVVMTEHLALFLGLAALLCYLKFRDAGGPADAVLSLLFATLAVYTRAYYAFLPLAFAAASLSDRGNSPLPLFRASSIVHRPSFLAPLSSPPLPPSPLLIPRSSLLSSLLWLLPIISFIPMTLFWHGLTPPSYQGIYHAGFQWKNATSVLIWTGIIFLPWTWRGLRSWHLLALAAVPAVLLAPLPGLGVTRTSLSQLPPPLAIVLAGALASVGLLWLLRLGELAIHPPTKIAAMGALLLAAGLVFSGPQVYERYLLPGIPLMLICARPGTKPRLALAWSVLFLPLIFGHILHLAA